MPSDATHWGPGATAWKYTFPLAAGGRSTFGEQVLEQSQSISLTLVSSHYDHITDISYWRAACYKTHNCKPPTKHLLHPERSCQWRHTTKIFWKLPTPLTAHITTFRCTFAPFPRQLSAFQDTFILVYFKDVLTLKTWALIAAFTVKHKYSTQDSMWIHSHE